MKTLKTPIAPDAIQPPACCFLRLVFWLPSQSNLIKPNQTKKTLRKRLAFNSHVLTFSGIKALRFCSFSVAWCLNIGASFLPSIALLLLLNLPSSAEADLLTVDNSKSKVQPTVPSKFMPFPCRMCNCSKDHSNTQWSWISSTC